jgi:hypothetical protein
MKKMPVWTFSFLSAFTAALACLALGGCIFDVSQPAAPLTMQYIGNQGDTVSPLAVLRFAFSDSLASPLDFDFSPPVAQDYGITFNSSRDTATLSFVDMLPGDTRYVLKLKSTITAKNGSTIDPGNDSAMIWTGTRESEPNNSPATADTLRSPKVWGQLSDARDTDVYCVPSPQKAYYLENLFSQISFSVKDSLLQTVTVNGGSAAIDTFTIPVGTQFPIYILVFSPIKGTVGNYAIGIVQKTN